MSKSTNKRAREHPAHIWERQRPHFTRLYKDEQRGLAEVQQILQNEHDFHATAKQYKRKIKQWHLCKNSKAVEKEQALVALKRCNARLDMSCAYKLQGRIIAAHKLRRHARSKGGGGGGGGSRGNMGTGPVSQHVASTSTNTIIGTMWMEFFSSIVCFVWFEEWNMLRPLPRTRSPLSTPTLGFVAYTKSILRLTQLTPTHVILASLYIYRLKSYNPIIAPQAGSEYRILSTALMVVNKFLDDYSYTNRTWATITGIPVLEISISEVEFLSNMRYALIVQDRDWTAWLGLLTSLHGFLPRCPTAAPRIIEIELMDALPPDPCTIPPEVAEDGTTPEAEVSLQPRTDDVDDAPAGESSSPKPPPIRTSQYVSMSSLMLPEGRPPFDIVEGHTSAHKKRTESNILYPSPSDIDNPVPTPTHDLSSTSPPPAPTPTPTTLDTFSYPAMHKDLDIWFSLLSPFPSWPHFSTTLTMHFESPPPDKHHERNLDPVHLEWKNIESAEVQEGPISFFDLFIESEMWPSGSSSSSRSLLLSGEGE